eukprot:1216208-Alexandrium_andersonii.AAC.1
MLAMHHVTKPSGDGEAKVAAYNYCRTCINLHKAGKSHRGRLFLSWNGFTRRAEFLYVKKSFQESFARTWETQTTSYSETGGEAPALERGGLRPGGQQAGSAN